MYSIGTVFTFRDPQYDFGKNQFAVVSEDASEFVPGDGISRDAHGGGEMYSDLFGLMRNTMLVLDVWGETALTTTYRSRDIHITYTSLLFGCKGTTGSSEVSLQSMAQV